MKRSVRWPSTAVAASDGEVEDHALHVGFLSDGTVDSGKSKKIASRLGGGPSLANGDRFGFSLAALGDLDGDGVVDLAVGADRDDMGGSYSNHGAIHVLLLNADGTVKSSSKIASGIGGGPTLASGDYFGGSLAALGDLNGDGVVDLAVGARGDDTGGYSSRGAVHVLLLNRDGTVQQFAKIASGVGGGPTLADHDYFGGSVALIGDLDGDGVAELAIGAECDDTGGSGPFDGSRGAVHVLFLKRDAGGPRLESIRRGGPMEVTNADSLTFRVTFNEDVVALDAADFSLSGGSTAAVTNVTAIGPTLFDLTVSGGDLASFTGLVGIDLAPGQNITDRSGNLLPSHEPTIDESYTLDNRPPTLLAVTRRIPRAELTSASGLRFRVEFDEPVRQVDAADFSVTGTNATIASVTAVNSRVFDLNVSGGNLATVVGTVGLALSPRQNISDELGNSLAAGTPAVNQTYSRVVSTLDFGDAPDAAAGSGFGDYPTRLADNGPRHVIVAGLKLGAFVDAEPDVVPDHFAAEDDRAISPDRDDEDGVVSTLDLQAMVGSQPTITLRATNTTGDDAVLYGWIDYNRDGVFDNATEQASTTVPDATSDGRFTLVFPTIPAGSASATYARFRLSTDAAAANPSGSAGDGEVEDFSFLISSLSDGAVDDGQSVKIAHGAGGSSGPTLADDDEFGSAVAAIGDFDGDGVGDLVAGAPRDETGGFNRGAIHLLLMNADGTVKRFKKIASGIAGGPTLSDGDYFGSSVAGLGDLDGDGVIDLAVGARGDDTGGTYSSSFSGRGAVHVLFMNADGTVRQSTKVASGTGGGPTLASHARFCSSLAPLGDLDGDGVTELAVGAERDSSASYFSYQGAVHVLFLKTDGTAKRSAQISSGLGGGPTLTSGDLFGSSVAALGDLNGDGIADLAVGATGDGYDRGAVHVLLLKADGTAASFTKIASGNPGEPSLARGDRFGRSVSAIGDLDGDGVTDLAVGADEDNAADTDRGAVHLLLLNSNGTLKGFSKITSGIGGGPTLAEDDYFGSSVASLGDRNGDGVGDLAVGARGDDTGGSFSFADRGAVHVLFLHADGTVKSASKIASGAVGGLVLGSDNQFGSAVAAIGDFDGDGVGDLAVGAPGDRTGGSSYFSRRGAVHLLLLNADGTVKRSTKIASRVGGGPTLADGDYFGRSVTSLGDLDGDGVIDLAVGATGDDTGGSSSYSRGAVHLLFLNSDGAVKRSVKIASDTSGGPTLANGDSFGSSLAALGDLDGDGVGDLAVGASGDDTGGYSRGAVHVLLLNSDGTVKNSTKIASGTNGGPTLVGGDQFGSSIALIGDLDGDGVSDLAVGASGDDTGGFDRGAVHILLLNPDGTVKQSGKIASGTGGGPSLANGDRFGNSVTSLGDLDGDGVLDLAVGADRDDSGGSSSSSDRGAVHVVLLNADGTAKRSIKIANQLDGGPTLRDDDYFGSSVASLGDLNGDGVVDLAVGAREDDTGFFDGGAVHVLFLKPDTTGPTFTITRQFPAVQETNSDFLVFRATFSEDALGIDAADFVVRGGSTATIDSVTQVSPLVFEVTVDDGDLFSFNGVVGLDLSSGQDITDRAGNPLADEPAIDQTYTLDNQSPTLLSISRHSPRAATTSADALTFRAAFGEVVLGVDAGDFSVYGYSVATGTNLSAVATSVQAVSDRVFDLTFSDVGLANFVGTIRVGWNGGDIADVAGNPFFGGQFAPSESYRLIQSTTDFGDAPDATAGSGFENYRTRLADDGPRHEIVAGLKLGAAVDAEPDVLPDDLAAEDDRFFAAGRDDEDGVLFPGDLLATNGSQPTVTLLATNTTGAAATLFGWIDTNRDGLFDNVTEWASIAVPDATTDGRFTLVFPEIPDGSIGKTYARFRISTDAAAADPTGSAADGEVEDYVFRMFDRSRRVPRQTVKIASGFGGGPTLADDDYFGGAIASLGDLDGDGVGDLAVGAERDDTGSSSSFASRGAVHVLFMNADGTVKRSSKIASGIGGGPNLADSDFFGSSIAALGDLDGDGVIELAVGATGDDSSGLDRGAVHVLWMNADGTVKRFAKIASGTIGGPTLNFSDAFGSSLASLGDLDGDGVTDLAVGTTQDDTGGSDRGAVHVLLLNADGTVKRFSKIASSLGGGPLLFNGDHFGSALAGLGDLDGDGVTDLAVGADRDDIGGTYSSSDRGAVHVLFMNADGTVKRSTKIASGTGGGPTLAGDDYFGGSLASAGDLDGDGVADLAVGAKGDSTGGFDRGAVHLLLLKPDGTVLSSSKIASGTGGGPTLQFGDYFGSSVAWLGDLDGDGIPELAAGAERDDTGGNSNADRGAVHIVSLTPRNPRPPVATAFTRHLPATSPTDADTLVFRVEFNKPVSGVDKFDFAASGTTAELSVTMVSPSVYQVTLTGGNLAGLNGTVELNLSATPTILDRDGILVVKTEPAIDEAYAVSNQPSDFGDAPDLSVGTGYGDYQTLLADGGPRHSITATQFTLFLGNRVDGEVEARQDNQSSGDDRTLLPHDEDGVLFAGDLRATIGSQPTIALRATNLTARPATLFGWIDFNRDGIFDNAAERTQIAVPAGTNAGRFTLAFPTIPGGMAGKTFARFRLSTDAAAANATGAASDGEVEDFSFAIEEASSGRVQPLSRIPDYFGGGPALSDYDQFGSSIAALGDLDEDGVVDLAVGAFQDDTGGVDRGAIYVLFMNANGTVKRSLKIAHELHSGPLLSDFDGFGRSLAAVGDLDGDGVFELAVGADRDHADGNFRGAVHVLFLNSDGTVKRAAKIEQDSAAGLDLKPGGRFGRSVAAVGDLDGDGVNDLAVGAYDTSLGNRHGAVHVLLMNADGTVKQATKIADNTGGGPDLAEFNQFGKALAGLGDLDGDGVSDLAVGDIDDRTGGGDFSTRGAVHVLLLNPDGTVKSFSKIADNTGGGPRLNPGDQFGSSIAPVGDLDGDGVADLAVGAERDDIGGGAYSSRGAVHLLRLNSDGSVKSSTKVASDTSGGPTLSRYDSFGVAVALLGDLNGDGFAELAVGVKFGDSSGTHTGTVHVLSLQPDFSGPTLSFTRHSPAVQRTDADAVVFRATFNEDALHVDAADFEVSGLTSATITSVVAVRASVYEITVSGGNLAGFNGPLGLNLAAGHSIADRYGNPLLGAEPAIDETFVIDNRAPVLLAFERWTPRAESTSAATLQFRAVFDEVVRNVDVADFVVTGSTAVISAINAVSGSVYELTVNGGDLASFIGGIGINLSAGQDIVDVLGRPLPAGEPAVDEIFSRVVSTLDFGDAPDAAAGSGGGNYRTRLADNGPRHGIVAGLKLGAAVDAEPDVLPDASAAEDDRFVSPGRDDEDGVLFPGDLRATVGAQPTVALLATNTTGSAATLFGWIDFNRDGLFDNATERAQVAVPTATTNGRFTLVFPTIPQVLPGETYARFRLSTDAAAGNSTDSARDGEVEDFSFSIASPVTNEPGRSVRFAGDTDARSSFDYFGSAVASLGDLDGDGVADLAVGASRDSTSGSFRGAVHVQFLNADGTVKRSTKIASEVGGGPTLHDFDFFGSSLAGLGDIDGDGVNDLAVGAYNDSSDNHGLGAVHLLLLNADGTVKRSTKINSQSEASFSGQFGRAITSLGDLDGDGVIDLAVGNSQDLTFATNDSPYSRGAVQVLFLNSDGTLKHSTKIGNNTGGGPTFGNGDSFGQSVAALGDLDGDGVVDLAVGAHRDRTGGYGRGAVHVLLLNSDGTVKSSTKIADNTGGGPTLSDGGRFGSSLAALGDLDGDGVTDLAIGAEFQPSGDDRPGAVHILLLNSDGTAKSSTAIASELDARTVYRFGNSVASLGDLNGDGVAELAVGAVGDRTGGPLPGAVQVLFLNATPREVEVSENSSEVLTVSGDFPPGATPRLSLANSADVGLFYLEPFSGRLAFYSPPDFENPTDADGDNVYEVRVLIDDQLGTVTSQLIHVSVTDAVAPVLSFGVLTIEGGDGADAFIVMPDANDGVRVVQWLGSGTGSVTRFALSDIDRIEISGGDGSDFVFLSRNVPLLTVLEGGGGSDFFRGGGGSNLIVGGPNSDLILGGDARDVLIGGEGFDFVFGGTGDDVLIGGNVANSRYDLTYLQYLWNLGDDFETRAANVRSIANLTGADLDLLFGGGGQNLTLTPQVAASSGAAGDDHAGAADLEWMPSSVRSSADGVAGATSFIAAPRTLLATLHPLIASNPFDPNDINGDGRVTPLDALASINDLNFHGARALFVFADDPAQPGACNLAKPIAAAELGAACNVRGRDNLFLDASLDDLISPLDTLLVINAINAAVSAHTANGNAEGEGDTVSDFGSNGTLRVQALAAASGFFERGGSAVGCVIDPTELPLPLSSRGASGPQNSHFATPAAGRSTAVSIGKSKLLLSQPASPTALDAVFSEMQQNAEADEATGNRNPTLALLAG